MAPYSKSRVTKEAILQTARELFYQQGYHATTTRQLVRDANSNLGLIKYHFNSKADIALAIYDEIRAAVGAWVEETASDMTATEQVLLFTTAEIQLAFTSPEFARFFTELYEEPKALDAFRKGMYSIIPETFVAVKRQISTDHIMFIEACILGTKLNIIRYICPDHAHVTDPDSFLSNHMRLFVELMNTPDPDGTVEKCLNMLKAYDFRLLPKMVPQITKR